MVVGVGVIIHCASHNYELIEESFLSFHSSLNLFSSSYYSFSVQFSFLFFVIMSGLILLFFPSKKKKKKTKKKEDNKKKK